MPTCLHCRAAFTPTSPAQVYCAPRCRNAAFAANAVVIKCRLTAWERTQLDAVAAAEGDSISGIIRDALYQLHGIGEWPTPSSLVGPQRPAL